MQAQQSCHIPVVKRLPRGGAISAGSLVRTGLQPSPRRASCHTAASQNGFLVFLLHLRRSSLLNSVSEAAEGLKIGAEGAGTGTEVLKKATRDGF